MNWAELITELQAAGITQVQMAERCGCTQSTICDIRNGRVIRPRYEIGAGLMELRDEIVSRAKWPALTATVKPQAADA